METITVITNYAKGRRLFHKPGVGTAFAAIDADTGVGIRGKVWVEIPGRSPQVGEGAQFHDLFGAADRRAVR